MQILTIAACSSVAIGMGWTFAEVRRFFFHTTEFANEAIDDRNNGRVISLVLGVAFLFIGASLSFHVFGIGAPMLSGSFPYVVDGSEGRRFLIIFGCFLAVWCILSGISTRLIPPPLFSAQVTTILCRIVRGGLLLLLAVVIVIAFPRIGDRWLPDGVGILCTLLAFLAIYTGELWNHRYIGDWPVPPVTCADRPFPFVASILVSIGLAYILLVA